MCTSCNNGNVTPRKTSVIAEVRPNFLNLGKKPTRASQMLTMPTSDNNGRVAKNAIGKTLPFTKRSY